MLYFVHEYTDIAWTWYAVIGGVFNIIVSIIASIIIDGKQKNWSLYSIPGQKAKFKLENKPEKENGWYVIPGKLDRVSYYLLGFFVLTIVFLLSIENFIK